MDFKENLNVRFMCVHSRAEIFQSAKVRDNCYFIVMSREFAIRFHYEYCLISSIGEVRESLGFASGGNLLSVGDYHKGVRLESEVLKNLSDANCLLVFFFSMCIFHELAHILNGHLDYIEFAEQQDEKFDQLTRQVLEWDADFFAVQKSMRFLANRTYTAEALKYSSSSFIEAVCIAIYSYIFMGWRRGPHPKSIIELAQEPSEKYPNYISRFMLSLNTIASESRLPKEWLNDNSGTRSVTVSRLFFEAFKVEADGALTDSSSKHFEALMAATDVYAVTLEFKWRDIHQELCRKRNRKSAIADIDHDFLAKNPQMLDIFRKAMAEIQ